MKILLIDPAHEHDLGDRLRLALCDAGFTLLTASDLATALALIADETPALVLLQVTPSRTTAWDLLRALRQTGEIPLIVLVPQGTPEHTVLALELGADDIVPWSVDQRELVARLRAVLRRAGRTADPPAAAATGAVLRVGPLVLDPHEHTVTHAGRPLRLTPTEFRLLHFLMRHGGQVAPTAVALREVWGYADPGGTDVVRLVLHRLRRKLGEDAAQPQLLHTIAGVGIMLKAIIDCPPQPGAGAHRLADQAAEIET